LAGKVEETPRKLREVVRSYSQLLNERVEGELEEGEEVPDSHEAAKQVSQPGTSHLLTYHDYATAYGLGWPAWSCCFLTHTRLRGRRGPARRRRH
jgi:hypothetical protein